MIVMENRMMGKVLAHAKFTNRDDRTLVEAGNLPADEVRQIETTGIVDTGAAMIVISEEMSNQLGLPFNSEVTVRYADSRTATRKIVGQLEVEILGRRSVFRAIVEPTRKEPLIGVIVLEDLDLLVDPRNQTLLPRDPKGEVYEIE
jgi:clan AA aspartic protease